jgi:hypothetical protein
VQKVIKKWILIIMKQERSWKLEQKKNISCKMEEPYFGVTTTMIVQSIPKGQTG